MAPTFAPRRHADSQPWFHLRRTLQYSALQRECELVPSCFDGARCGLELSFCWRNYNGTVRTILRAVQYDVIY
jgi:hypothetical protein